MPKYRVLLLVDWDSKEGTHQEWDLPWERLVYDQRFPYKPSGAELEERYVVRRIRSTPEGLMYDVVKDPGCREGGDPKRDR